MDGRLTVLFWLLSIPSGEVTTNELSVNRADTTGRAVLSAGTLEFGGTTIGQELRYTYMFDQKKGRFNPTFDVSITDEGGLWVGAGLYQQFDIEIGQQTFFVGSTFAPGLYIQGNEVDLGFPIEFRSGLEVGMRFDNDWQVSLYYDHRSNGDIVAVNPGMETLQLRLSKTFN